MNLFSLFTASILSSNILLSKFLGICPFIGVSKERRNAFKMGITVTFVMVASSIITYFIYYHLLAKTETEYLKTVVFVLVIAGLVQVLELIIKKTNKHLHDSLGIYLPLIATNCAVLGTVLLNVNNNYNLKEIVVYSLGGGIGFTIVIYLFSTIRERLETCKIINKFKGVPIALITASIMAMLFARYIGG